MTQLPEAMGGQPAGCGRGAPAPAAAALPCQNSNNSNQTGPRYPVSSIVNSAKNEVPECVVAVLTMEDADEFKLE